MMLSLSRVVLLCAYMGQCLSAKWGYGEHIVNWGKSYPKCNGERQSPIDITTNTANTKYIRNFNFKEWDEIHKMTVVNNGHTVVFSIPHSTVKTTGGGLRGTFKLAQFHFHWGSHSEKGSEHKIDGQAFPMEVHFVHFNNKYGTFGKALPKPDGLAVLGFMFEISSDDNPAMKPIVDILSKLNVKSQTKEGVTTSMPANQFLPDRESVYYGYTGSLTTPTCDESVAWRVFQTPISISEAQMAKFRELKDDHKHKIVDNFRPVQDLNYRKVWWSATDEALGPAPGPPPPPGPAPAVGGTSVPLSACMVTMVTCVWSAMFGLPV